MSMGTNTDWEYWAQCTSCPSWGTLYRAQQTRNEWLNVSFDTKENWYNNQRIYEYEMYRPFRRPDGTTFYLYERQGFFTDKGEVECADCARDDEING